MKAFVLGFLITVILFRAHGQEKRMSYQFYQFESICSFTYTTNKSKIFTFYNNGSFSLEMFSNKRGGEQLYTRIVFSGNWERRNDSIFLQYLNREIKSVTRNGRNVFSSDLVLDKEPPTSCVIMGEVLSTDTASMGHFHTMKDKALAVGEKWAYENALRMSKATKTRLL